MLRRYLELIDQISLEQRLDFAVFGSLDAKGKEAIKIDLTWIKQSPTKPKAGRWAMTIESKKSYFEGLETPELLLLLDSFHADLKAFEFQLEQTVLLQAAYADMILGDIRGLCGDEKVDLAIESNQAFLSALKKMVDGFLKSDAEASDIKVATLNSTYKQIQKKKLRLLK